MMTTMLLGLGLLLAVIASGFFSGSETGIYCCDRVRLRVASAHRHSGARRLAAMMRRPEDLVITMLLGTNVADYLATACTSALLLRVVFADHLAEIYATLIVTPLILVFGGIIPKDWFRRESDQLMYTLAWPVSLSLRLARATGLVWLLRGLTHTLIGWLDPEHLSDERQVLPRTRMLGLLREGAARGGLTIWQRDVIDRIMGISKIPVARVMIPRVRSATVSINIAHDDFMRIVQMAHFSRLPVYDEDERRIVGIVNVYDVLTDPHGREIRDHLRDAFRLSAGASVSGALLRMQRARQVMAIVEDHDGQCLGLLTIKDLAEEIIGDFEAW
ncbi:MAG: CNNM domain-containing protein [Planctomycetota bacterium]